MSVADGSPERHLHVVAAPLDPAQTQVLDDILPLLQEMHDNVNTLSGILPEDHSRFPGEVMQLEPYYMGTSDPETVGVWALKVGGPENLRLKAQIVATPGDREGYIIRTPGEDNKYREASPDDLEAVVGLLGLLRAVPIARETLPSRARRLHGIGHLWHPRKR